MSHSSNGDAPGRRTGNAFDLDALLHPASAFAHPLDVVRDRDLTFNDTRAILASCASDHRALDAAPTLRRTQEGGAIQSEIMDALRVLGREAGDGPKPPPHYRRVLANRVAGVFGRKSRGPVSDGRQGSIN